MADILAIDDDPACRRLFQEALKPLGHRVMLAADAQRGLAIATETRPALVVLDLEMPGMDGAACLSAIRASGVLRDIPVLIVTGAPTKAALLRVASMGVSSVVVKGPSLIAELRRRVPLALGQPSERTELGASPAPTPTPTPTAQRTPEVAVPVSAPATESPPGERTGLNGSAARAETVALSPANAAELLRALPPLASTAEIEKRIAQSGELKPFPPAASEVLSLAGSAASSLDAVARAVKKDPALSVKVLKLANSSFYRRGPRVETVVKAVGNLGMSQLRDAVLCMGVMDQLTEGAAGPIRPQWFWEHSLGVGLIASALCTARGEDRQQAESMFTTGLLHDVGRMFLVQRMPDLSGAVLKAAGELDLPLDVVESHLLTLNHAELSDRVLRAWRLPHDLIGPLALHHATPEVIRRKAPGRFTQAATLALANRLAHALVLGSSGNDVLSTLEEFTTALDLTPSAIASVVANVPNQTAELLGCILMHATPASVTESALNALRKQMPPTLSVLHACDDPTSDSASILFSRLCLGGDTPNLCVAQVNTPGAREGVVAGVVAAERAARVFDLPLLVFAATPACTLDPGAVEGRPMRQLVLPATYRRIAAEVKHLLAPAR